MGEDNPPVVKRENPTAEDLGYNEINLLAFSGHRGGQYYVGLSESMSDIHLDGAAIAISAPHAIMDVREMR